MTGHPSAASVTREIVATRGRIPRLGEVSSAAGGSSSEWCQSVGRDGALEAIEALSPQCKEGSWSAWESLFPLMWPVLVTFVHRLYPTFDKEDAEDVAQASLQAAIRSVRTFSGTGLFRAWLFGIASKQAAMFRRLQTAKKRGFGVVVPFDGSIDRQDYSAKSPAETLAANDRAGILYRALDELDEDDRDLVFLHFFGDLTFKEIGEARNMNPKTVCTRLSRCKQELLRSLVRSRLTNADG